MVGVGVGQNPPQGRFGRHEFWPTQCRLLVMVGVGVETPFGRGVFYHSKHSLCRKNDLRLRLLDGGFGGENNEFDR